ncbi:hypothetical protein BDK51DRAFT_45280 [Blyttiomyces helicus]|uniref:Uncharacterized protein n=1 Tax=Blyttiomyces helicus TaxID=388810 RepID=A0A4P9W547_9FUNG|nr:hypothetical protein BDK51DRAFT_45280 [Blyttiomyces helicus]|eukprot:RKO85236.1 hypothetical protein BDK51DRAFT_45280 [Blyttiomyces helicus]
MPNPQVLQQFLDAIVLPPSALDLLHKHQKLRCTLRPRSAAALVKPIGHCANLVGVLGLAALTVFARVISILCSNRICGQVLDRPHKYWDDVDGSGSHHRNVTSFSLPQILPLFSSTMKFILAALALALLAGGQ